MGSKDRPRVSIRRPPDCLRPGAAMAFGEGCRSEDRPRVSIRRPPDFCFARHLKERHHQGQRFWKCGQPRQINSSIWVGGSVRRESTSLAEGLVVRDCVNQLLFEMLRPPSVIFDFIAQDEGEQSLLVKGGVNVPNPLRLTTALDVPHGESVIIEPCLTCTLSKISYIR